MDISKKDVSRIQEFLIKEGFLQGPVTGSWDIALGKAYKGWCIRVGAPKHMVNSQPINKYALEPTLHARLFSETVVTSKKPETTVVTPSPIKLESQKVTKKGSNGRPSKGDRNGSKPVGNGVIIGNIASIT